MSTVFKRAAPYQEDVMNLPVPDVNLAVPFYETVMGFTVVSRQDLPHKRVVLARDHVRNSAWPRTAATRRRMDASSK